MNVNLTDSELEKVSEVIASRTGLFFPEQKWKMLNRNLASAAVDFGYKNTNEFIQWLLTARINKKQIEKLSAHLTVSETYFWREPQVFSAFTDFILPELIDSKKNKEKTIRILSAACSTGEEPYSIAIALHRSIPEIKDWNIIIQATDINEKALAKARSGVYNPWSFRNSPPWLKSRYFEHMQNRKYALIPEIREMVTFVSCNLTEDDCFSVLPHNGSMDIIFCRNMLMYFTPEWAEKISEKLFRLLSKDGWLIVASCELSSQLFPKLLTVNFPGAILYRKTFKESDPSSSKHDDFPAFASGLPEDPLFSYAFEAPAPQPPPPQSIPGNTSKKNHSGKKIPLESYSDKVSAIRLLAGQGHLTKALAECNAALGVYKLYPGLYLLLASILQELDKREEAIIAVKQAVYIDPDYIMGHFTLGNIYFRLGKMKSAEKYFKNALELLNSESDDDIPEESEGLSVKYIREIILANLGDQKSK
jgi:chemotaxis protein methyltransferase CheR